MLKYIKVNSSNLAYLSSVDRFVNMNYASNSHHEFIKINENDILIYDFHDTPDVSFFHGIISNGVTIHLNTKSRIGFSFFNFYLKSDIFSGMFTDVTLMYCRNEKINLCLNT